MAKAPVFYLGTHMDGWLAHVGVPLFVSHRRLARRKTLPKARRPVLKLDVQFSTEMSNACPIGHARETNWVARLSRPQARDVHWTGAGASASEPRVPLG